MNQYDQFENDSPPMPRVGALIRAGREAEGLRMASALGLGDNDVEVLILGASLAHETEINMHLDSLDIEEVPVLALFEDPRVQCVTWRELTERLEDYDHVVTF